MHVGRYRKRYFLEKGTGRSDPLQPPFYCPWASPEGCDWPPCYNQKEHQHHIRTVHEIPGERERGIWHNHSGVKTEEEEHDYTTVRRKVAAYAERLATLPRRRNQAR